MQEVAFSTVPYDFAENEYVVEPQASSPTAAALRTGTGIWIRRSLPRGRPAQSPLHPRTCSGALPPRCLAGLVVMTLFLMFVVH